MRKSQTQRNFFSRCLACLLLLMLAGVTACAQSTTPSPNSSNSPSSAFSALTSYVNPFLGTTADGNTFPGATYPMGMVQWSPDTTSHIPGGYSYRDTTIRGFSLTHFSGRGCNVYEDIPFLPYAGTVGVSPALSPAYYASQFSHNNEAASPGYYRVRLNGDGPQVELSVTPRTGMGRFTYPTATAASLLIDVGGSINGDSNSAVTLLPSQQQVTGFATSTVGCGSNPYTVYFAAQFDTPFQHYGTWQGTTLEPGVTSSSGAHAGAFMTFALRSTAVVQVQVGISFVSIANAQANLAAEDAHFDFAHVRQQADAAWNSRLSSIQVQGGSVDEKATFYTALYHSFIHPNIFSDANGQYLGFDGMVHTLTSTQHAQYENITGWDAYRSLIRLLAILDPGAASDIAQSLINDAVQGDGHLPRWVQANADSRGMNGDDGAAMIAEAFAFGATHFDTATALSLMLSGQPHIREGFTDYSTLGYVAADTSTPDSAAVTLEYANDDFAIAQFAQAPGNTQAYQLMLQHAASWQQLFNPATGYIEPRNSNGSWMANFTPQTESGFREGTSSQYTWMVPFDLPDLFTLMGGKAVAVHRLDHFFTRLNAGTSSLYAYLGNEPSFEVPWEYDFAGAPSHTQAVVRRIQLDLFKNAPDGLPGNDDGGAMSSWYIFSAIGLYPEITGVGGFVVGSPLFTSVTIQSGNGHMLHIDAPTAADSSPYVQGLQINAASTTGLWIPWNALQNGATFRFALGRTPASWGSSPSDAPPTYTA